ncbi:MAG: hypothetical protein AB1349_04400 [Elusimicrobiota bacterium]
MAGTVFFPVSSFTVSAGTVSAVSVFAGAVLPVLLFQFHYDIFMFYMFQSIILAKNFDLKNGYKFIFYR